MASNSARYAGKLGLELLVVFIGVYAASALTDLHNRRQADTRRQQLEAALVREIKDLSSNARYVATSLPQALASYDSAVAAGARPGLEPWTEPVRVDAHMWQAALQSGAMDLFDVPTIYEISKFYNKLTAGFEQIAQLRSLSETVLIPNLDKGPDEFYDSRGQLRTKYKWHRDGLGRLAQLAAQITQTGDSLAAKLAVRH